MMFTCHTERGTDWSYININNNFKGTVWEIQYFDFLLGVSLDVLKPTTLIFDHRTTGGFT